jgi:glucose-6-phosphate dehydrogenase assembly protein OpcA
VTETHVVGSWSGRDAVVSDAEEAIRRFRSLRAGGAVRHALRSLVVLADADRATGMTAAETAREVGARSPGRTIVLVALPGGAASGTDAEVTVYAIEGPGGTYTCLEEVVLLVRGAAAGHLDAVLRPWLLPGLPVVVWLPARMPDPHEAVVGRADRIVVDSRRFVSSSLPGVVPASHGLPVCDLAWARLHAWRMALGGLFTGAEFSPFTGGVERVDATGRRPTLALLAGWLVSSLALAPAAVRLEEEDRITVRIAAGHGGRSGTFSVEQAIQGSDDRTVRLSAAISGGPSHRRSMRMSPQTVATDLERALSSPLTADQTWAEALAAAVTLG